MKVKLWLWVENNSKWVRGKSKVRREIEDFVLAQFDMVKPDPKGLEYLLSIPYTTDAELDEIIYDEIFSEMQYLADARHCFIEADMTAVDDPERRW